MKVRSKLAQGRRLFDAAALTEPPFVRYSGFYFLASLDFTYHSSMFKFIAFKEVSCTKLGHDEWKEEHLTIYIVADASDIPQCCGPGKELRELGDMYLRKEGFQFMIP